MKRSFIAVLAFFVLGSALGQSPAKIRITTWNLEWFPNGSPHDSTPEKQAQHIEVAAGRPMGSVNKSYAAGYRCSATIACPPQGWRQAFPPLGGNDCSSAPTRAPSSRSANTPLLGSGKIRAYRLHRGKCAFVDSHAPSGGKTPPPYWVLCRGANHSIAVVLLLNFEPQLAGSTFSNRSEPTSF
jgi:hypothetical protein